MGNITLSLPNDVHNDMRKFNDIRWSEVARRAIIDKIAILKQVENIAQKSKLTQKDADEISRKIKTAATKRLLG